MSRKLMLLLSTALALGAGPALAGGELTYVVNNESATFDPGTSAETFALPVIGSTFEGLVKFGPDGAVLPAVAKSWDVSADGLTYTFHLRDDAKWSDGKPVTAGDFVYAWKRVLTPATGAKNAPMLYVIKGAEEFFADQKKDEVAVRAVDDHTFEFTLKAPLAYMMQLLPFQIFDPVRKDMVEASPEGWTRDPKTFIGNGPFKVSEFNFGKSTVLEKNADYYDAAKVSLDKLTFRLIADPATALAAYEAGDVDGIEAVPGPELPRLSSEDGNGFLAIPALGTTFAHFNPAVKPFDDVRVRKALAEAIDRQNLIEFVMQTADQPALGLVPPGINVAGQDFRTGTSDFGLAPTAKIEDAKKLLAEAGYPDGKGFPETVYVTYSTPAIQKQIEAVQQMWKQNLGIDVKIQASEWQVYYPEVQKIKYQIAQMGWGADYPHPMTFLDIFTSDSPNNLSGWKNPEYDKLIAEAKVTQDPAKSLDDMRKAEALVMNDMVILPFYYRNTYMMMKPYVKGFWRSSLNQPYFDAVTLEK
ncbi:peptide ABC transporter substrate-binding protein [Oryzibacter oryziterrae]|uniref:peptide ABC transporter substrate-binding protein n=1 Tax=Oryzibacter oryziterrae TaxID=2766474 RepID=UPI001F3B4C6B|nr:peptide ABC transporter substrate-binding protein [Oryzibacter oryziterrae]